MKNLCSVLLFLLVSFTMLGKDVSVLIRDASTQAPVPFAAIRFDTLGQGVIADLNGVALISPDPAIRFVEVTAMGYESRRIIGQPDSVIWLKPKKETLAEVVIKPDHSKIRRIIHEAVNHRRQNNPDQYDWYRCHIYYKMLADMNLLDDSPGSDTTRRAMRLKEFSQSQHLLLSETYSIRTWKRPQKLQEEILASRFSGLKKSVFAGLVTDFLPFHAYSDYLKLNGKDYRNPVSRGSEQWYKFNMRDEILQGADTIWMISFFPKKPDAGLHGSVYISSRNFAIANFIGTASDTILGNHIRIEQQYRFIQGRWFPKELNYIFRIMQNRRKEGVGAVLKGSSSIDSVSFSEDESFRFDKVHTVKLKPLADDRLDSSLCSLRPEALDKREERTYTVLDSVSEIMKLDRMMPLAAKLIEAKLPVGPVDLNLERIYSANLFEGRRPGIGLQTNDRVSRYFSVGGWAGYGTKDHDWKYGGFAEVYLDANRESKLRGGWERDIRDPGRVRLHRDLDRTYLRNYLITIADRYEAAWLAWSKQLGYLQTELSVRSEQVQPQYAYLWQYEDTRAQEYRGTEIGLNLRYAFAERQVPAFGKYVSAGSRFPIVYLRANYGQLDIGQRRISYTQALIAIAWKKHLARIGEERWQIQAGKSFSDIPLPLGKTFAGSGYRNDRYPLSMFGGLQTVYPFTFFSDAYLSWSWRHDFDWRLYRANLSKAFSSQPGLALVYNGIWGAMSQPEVHQGLPFRVPDAGYHEGGILLNNILRIKQQFYYLGLTIGYFHPLQGRPDFNNGTFVVGGSFSL